MPHTRLLTWDVQAYPIIEALRTNTTLKHIDVSRYAAPIATTVVCHVNVVSNRLGDEGLHILCEVITQGTCALRSFNAERNRITLKVFSSILMHFFLF